MFRSRAGLNLSHRSPFFARQYSSLFRKHIFHHYLQFACSQPDFIFKNPHRGSDASEREAGRGTNRSEILLLTYVCVHTNYQVACCGPLFAVCSRVVKNGVYSVTLNANSCLMAAISEMRVGWKLENCQKTPQTSHKETFNWLWISPNLIPMPLYDLHKKMRPSVRRYFCMK